VLESGGLEFMVQMDVSIVRHGSLRMFCE